MLDELPAGLPDAAFRLTLPGARFAPRPLALERLLLHVEHTHDGLRLLALKDGTTARLVRTAAYARAVRVAQPGEDLDVVLDQVAGAVEVDARAVGFGRSIRVAPAMYPRTGGPPVSADEAWVRVDKQVAQRDVRRQGEADA